MAANRTLQYRYAILAAFLCTSVPAIAQTEDHAPVALPSAQVLAQDKSGSESWTYARPASEFRKYRTVMIPAAVVYQGPDAQFEGISPADRVKFADMITRELRAEMAKSFPSPAKPQADTLRIQVTILGASKTTGGIATATRIGGLGFATSALKSVLGKPGSLTGSILYAVEAYDGRTNELMLAAVRRRTPDPLDVPATISQTETVKAVAREFADGARKRLLELTGQR
jgi:hypothetical protein